MSMADVGGELLTPQMNTMRCDLQGILTLVQLPNSFIRQVAAARVNRDSTVPLHCATWLEMLCRVSMPNRSG